MISFLKGLADFFSGFGLIFRAGVRRYVFIPLAINISLFGTAIYYFSQQLDSWIERLLPGWLTWLEWLIWPLFAVTIGLLVFYTFTLIANIVAAPFNSYLSAKLETLLTGEQPGSLTNENFWNTALRTVSAEFTKLFYFAKWLFPLIIVTVIPGINVVAPFCWIIFATWSFSLEYMDYPLGNRGWHFQEIRAYNRKNRMRSLGLGTGIFLITSIPFLNFLAMPVAVAGATRLTTKIREPL